MSHWVDRIAGLLPDAALAATIWTGLMALAMVGTSQPARRCLLARLALLGSLAVWPLVALAPLPRVRVIESLRQFTPPSGEVLRAPEIGTGSSPHQPRDILVGIESSASWTGAEPGWSAGRPLALVYSAGVGLGLAWLALGWGIARGIVRKSSPPRAPTRLIYGELPSRGVLPRPDLRVSRRTWRPALVGAIRSTILIPPRLEQAIEADGLRMSLGHELAHAERLDPFWGTVGGLAEAVWFFLPTVWWIVRQSSIDREFLADRRATEILGTGPIPYATSLVDEASATDPPTQPDGSGRGEPEVRGGSNLTPRVLMLIGCPFPVEQRSPLWWRLYVLPVGLGVVLLASTMTLRTPPDAPLDGSPRTLRVGQLTLSLDPSTDEDRECVLPIPLPPTYELDFEILARPIDLPLHRVAGYRIVPERGEGGGSPDEEREVWHRVRLAVAPTGSATAWVDGHEAGVRRARNPAQDRLVVRPLPGRVCRIRNLTLSWNPADMTAGDAILAPSVGPR